MHNQYYFISLKYHNGGQEKCRLEWGEKWIWKQIILKTFFFTNTQNKYIKKSRSDWSFVCTLEFRWEKEPKKTQIRNWQTKIEIQITEK
jgi:hypothetical protein